VKTHIGIGAVVLAVVLLRIPTNGQSSISVADLSPLTESIQHDFSSIEEIHTIPMTDDPLGRFDVIVVGGRPGRDAGWRVEAITIDHHRIKRTWDSVMSASEPEFMNSGRGNIDIRERQYDYDILIEGCVAHLCGDGINGFLIFSGKTGKVYKAKVVTQGLDKPVTGAPKYDVTFTPGISDEAKGILQDAICSSNATSNKSGLPFECKSQ
jgi:hypothetical protein